MKKLLIACFAILAVAALISDAAFAQRGHGGGGRMGHVAGGMGHGGGMRAGGFAGRGGPIGHSGGVAIGPRSVGPGGRAAFVGGRAYHGGQWFVTPGGVYGGGRPVARQAPFYGRPGLAHAHTGAHYPRHRHRGRGFVYYYGGWWYAYPWWDSYYGAYYSDDCTYWDRQCAWRWGYGTRRYYRCMRYHNC